MAYRGQRNAAVAPGFEFQPGFIYTQVRAICARINQNFDGWPSDELKKSYRSFLGKPCFVNHQNFDPKKARGKVVAARYVEAGDDKYIETVMEIDAQRFPKLAKEIKDGGLDSVVDGRGGRVHHLLLLRQQGHRRAGFLRARQVPQGPAAGPDQRAHRRGGAGDGLREVLQAGLLRAELCLRPRRRDLRGVPGDRGQQSLRPGPDDGRPRHHAHPDDAHQRDAHRAAAHRAAPHRDDADRRRLEARITRLAYGEIEAPEDVDTLRDEDDDGTNEFKNYVKSPKELQAPDMDQAKRLDRDQESEGLDANRRVEDVENISGPPTQGVHHAHSQRSPPRK